jgi:putative transposase
MTASESVNPAGLLREQLESASPDMLRAMVKTFADALRPTRSAAPAAEVGKKKAATRVSAGNGLTSLVRPKGLEPLTF